MNNKIKLLIILATCVYFFTSCDNGTTTTTDKDMTDTTKMSNMKNDTMEKKMSMDDMKMDNGLMNSMNVMIDKMSNMKMTGDFDLDFANMMIEHHLSAVDMSKIEITKGSDEKIKGMAQNIITKQNEEIGKMQEIIKNYKPSEMKTEKHDELSKGLNDMKSKMNGMQMTGNIDKDFVMMMVSHHDGAIKMFKDELSHGMNAQLKQMAQKGISDQAKEISEFKSWLDSKK
jgi:uncharacterized protein (DUF305 family)